MIYILLLSLLQSVMADLIPEPPYSYYPEDGLPGDNIFAGALLAMGICTCVGLACKHEPLPITITSTNEDSSDGTVYFEIEADKKSTKNYKQDIKKLKRDLRELQAILSKLDRC